jgi:hypothetical protein
MAILESRNRVPCDERANDHLEVGIRWQNQLAIPEHHRDEAVPIQSLPKELSRCLPLSYGITPA